MSNEIENQVIEYSPPIQSQADRLLEMAITKGADPAYLDKLLDMKFKYDAEEARKAYTNALASFKGEDILIVKDKQVSFNTSKGKTEYKHATLGNIIRIAVPLLSKHGLSHRWTTHQEGGRIRVTCTLTHKQGHSEPTSLEAGADDSGGKNSIQAIASTVSYLERYTFLAITGLAVEDQDNDGMTPPKPIELISEAQGNAIHAKITENELKLGIIVGFFQKHNPDLTITGIEDFPAAWFDSVIEKLDEIIAMKKKATK